jgi:DNA repair exonuclease SbcCD ATPase subunit
MAEALDVLIDQSVQRMLDLSASADQFLGAISQTDNAITEFTETVQAGSQEIQASFNNFTVKLDEAEQGLQTILQTTLETLDSLKSRVTQADEQTETILNELTTQLEQAKNFSDEATSSIQQQAETTQAALSESAQQIETFQTELMSQQESTTSSLGEFQSVAESAKQSFESSTENLTSQLEAFEQDVADKLTSLLADVDLVLEEGNTQLESFQSTLDSTSGDALSMVEELFVQQFPSELASSSDILDQGISLLKETGVDKFDDFAGKFSDILGSVDEILDLIEEIKPVLDMVNEYT